MKEKIKEYFSDFVEYIKFLLKFLFVWFGALLGAFIGGIFMAVLSPVLPIPHGSIPYYIILAVFPLLTGHGVWKFLKGM